MARARGKGGKYEEERVGSMARFDEIAAAVEDIDRERGEKATEEEILGQARRPMSFSPASVNRRVGVTLTLSLRAVDALDRMAITKGMKRGQLADEVILAVARVVFGKKGERDGQDSD